MEKTAKLYYSGHADRDRKKLWSLSPSTHSLYSAHREIYILKYSYEKLRFEFLISRSDQRKNKLNPKEVERRP